MLDGISRLFGISPAHEERSNPAAFIPARRNAPAANEDSALALTSVFRAVQILQTAGKQLTINIYRDGLHLEGEQVPRFIHTPAPGLTMADLVNDTIASLAFRGNAYWRIVRNSDGRVEGIHALPPLECLPILDPASGARRVRWRNREYTDRDMIHLRFLTVAGRAEGLSPIQACAATITAARDMQDYAQQWLDTSGVPTGILSTDQDITPDQAEKAKKRWNETHSHSGGVAVIGNGLKYTPVHLKPEEIQFLESRNFDVLEIGRMFGIPAHMLLASVEGNSMTYQNINDAATDFVRWTLMNYLKEIETALTRVLPQKTRARFNLDALLRADTMERMQTHALAINAGIYTPEHARKIEGITL